MRKFSAVIVLALAVQLALNAPLNSESHEMSLELVQKVYENLQKTLWSHEVVDNIKDYLNEIKTWSSTDEKLQESKIYESLTEHIDNCLSYLQRLIADPGNCENQWALRNEHSAIRSLLNSPENQEVGNIWLEKYSKFAGATQKLLKKSFDDYFSMVSTEIDTFINDAQLNSEIVAMREWNKKFTEETSYMKKRWMMVDFMDILPKERDALKDHVKCELQYCIGI
ncbi:uncharacterized protein LOC142224057 [Haematobia irritans]|uniref:uncharacterized protein LOC142224057 n=1 Tax=Haematobia irritans TaxID=7368 RepID=UPI003F50519D